MRLLLILAILAIVEATSDHTAPQEGLLLWRSLVKFVCQESCLANRAGSPEACHVSDFTTGPSRPICDKCITDCLLRSPLASEHEPEFGVKIREMCQKQAELKARICEEHWTRCTRNCKDSYVYADQQNMCINDACETTRTNCIATVWACPEASPSKL
jgi:hypothetical protein